MVEPVVHGALALTAAGDTWIGRREHNEDTFLLRPDMGLYVLADGAGGENAGNVASALATTAIAHHIEETEPAAREAPDFDEIGLSTQARRLAMAVQRANREILEIARSSQRHMGMGTTVVATLFDRARPLLHVAHIGDSRVYRLRDRHLELLTFDHTLVNDVLELHPDIDAGRAARLPRHVITRALGMSETVRVSIRTHEVLPGDKYLLCSDGLTDVVEEQAISDALLITKSVEDEVRLLLDLARDANSRDNVAALVVAIELAPGVAGRSLQTHTRTRPTRRHRRATSSEPEEDIEPDFGDSGDDDDPEIMIIGPDTAPDDDSQPAIHVVPPESVRPSMLNAVHTFVNPHRRAREDDTQVDLRDDDGNPVES